MESKVPDREFFEVQILKRLSCTPNKLFQFQTTSGKPQGHKSVFMEPQ
jgi:hypothetical protein